jgi:GDP-mannose 6-dehydrogenase
MRIAIFGLGYVGSVSSACLAAAGHTVIGVDVDAHKLSLIRSGRSPVSEPGLDEAVAKAVSAGTLTVTDDAAAAVHQSEVALICVGTPSRRNGSLDTSYLERVIGQIGTVLSGATSYYVVAVRSTLLPGILQTRLLPMLVSTSGRRVGDEIGVGLNPEFLREGSALRDFARPPFTIIGAMDDRAADTVQALYAHLTAPVHRVAPDEAAMLKYASNAYHALKVAFGNEVGALCQQLGVDGRRVMRIFCDDRDLNISSRYLRPGFGFGGSCLPKDIRAVTYLARQLDVALPLIGNVLASNDAHIQRVVDTVLESPAPRRAALVGLSFKVGSDDLRESPFVHLAEALIGKGVSLRIYDPDVALSQVFGRNQAYLQEHLPHVGQLMAIDLAEAMQGASVIVVGKRFGDADGLPALVAPDQTVIDLVGIAGLERAIRPWSAAQRAAIGVSDGYESRPTGQDAAVPNGQTDPA